MNIVRDMAWRSICVSAILIIGIAVLFAIRAPFNIRPFFRVYPQSHPRLYIILSVLFLVWAGAIIIPGLGRSVSILATPPPLSACPIADDHSYGYEPHNPIMIGGGGSFGGPLRTSAFLQALRGSNGQRVDYEWVGSTSNNGRSLEVFELRTEGFGGTLTIYFDQAADSTEAIRAPQGFICIRQVVLPEP